MTNSERASNDSGRQAKRKTPPADQPACPPRARKNPHASKKTIGRWLEWLCVLAVLALVVQIAWPSLQWWRNRPRPGVQVALSCSTYHGLIYLPPKYDSTNTFPLLIYLHGGGERGSDLRLLRDDQGPPGLIERGGQSSMIVVSPQCPAGETWGPADVLQLVDDLFDSFSVDQDRIYLTGYSMGGHGTWEAASADPNRFAAIVPVAGGGDPAAATRLATVPIWAFHGGRDTVISADRGQAMVEAVRCAGGSAKWTVFAEQGHDICGDVYSNPQLYDWLLSRRRQE